MLNSQTTKRIIEANYLCTENTWRYRTILRIAYGKYEKMSYWVYKEDIFNDIKGIQGFEKYTVENLKSDLDSLESWGNFIIIQDTRKTRTIEEFKNRQYRYQISPTTIELERTLIKLENTKETLRGSLEVSLIERFRDTITQFENIQKFNIKDLFSWWDMLNRDFKYLNENYQDYISKFYSPKTEDLLKTTEFLVFKENFIKYLREFIKGLQVNVPYIKSSLEFMQDENSKVDLLVKSIIDYEKNNISIDYDYDEKNAYDLHYGRYLSMKQWFISENGNPSMVDNLLDSTNEIIRKITRYALQIVELQFLGGNRKSEYRTIINMFNNCETMDGAHKLASTVFGVMAPRHISCNVERETESINSGIFNETPTAIIVKPSNRYREKTASRVHVKEKAEAKRNMAIEVLKRREEEQAVIESKIKDNKLIFKDLQHITKEERIIFLNWLSNALNKKHDGWIRNEYGNYYKIINRKPNENILIKCEDGDFYMPSYELVFKSGGN